jgi:hypothetical protein
MPKPLPVSMRRSRSKKSRGITTIQITEETRDELKECGKKGETYDDIIRKLLKRYSASL